MGRRPPVFFFNDTAATEIYTLSLHDALPICWEWGVRYLYDASPGLLAGQGIAAAVLISGGLVLLNWLAPVIHGLAWAYGLTLLAMAAFKAINHRRDR